MRKAITNSQNCKACGLCMEICKKNAIEMTDEINTRGYKYIRVKEEDCVGCGMCYIVCPDAVFTIIEKEEN